MGIDSLRVLSEIINACERELDTTIAAITAIVEHGGEVDSDIHKDFEELSRLYRIARILKKEKYTVIPYQPDDYRQIHNVIVRDSGKPLITRDMFPTPAGDILKFSKLKLTPTWWTTGVFGKGVAWKFEQPIVHKILRSAMNNPKITCMHVKAQAVPLPSAELMQVELEDGIAWVNKKIGGVVSER